MNNKEKQIEEMAKLTCKSQNSCYKGDCLGNEICAVRENCEALYNAGYRKVNEGDIGKFSDGYHTFNELYHHRAVLFSVICNLMPEKAWKSKLHDTGDMFDGMFIVGIETEQGQATYHYDIEPYWDMFKVKELDKAPKWDGHTPAEAIDRIGQIKPPKYIQANKIYSNATLESWKKEDLIKHIRALEHNWSSAEQRIDNQIQNFEKCVELKIKETAREILQPLYDKALNSKDYIADYHISDIQELAEKYGVEVE